MSSVSYIVGYQVNFYKKGSIFRCEGDLDDMSGRIYFPNYEVLVDLGSWSWDKHNHSKLDTHLTFLGNSEKPERDDIYDAFYLVNEDMIYFELSDSYSLDSSYDQYTDDSYMEDIEHRYIIQLYEDIKNIDHLYNINNCGYSDMYVRVLLAEHWSQGFDDWDCDTEYLGILKRSINPLYLLEEKCVENYKSSRKFENEFYDNYQDFNDLWQTT